MIARKNTGSSDQRAGRVQSAGLTNRAASEAAAEGVAAVRLPLIGLILVQVFVGYEWLISGLTKVARGGFPAGLADELTEKSAGAPGWYVSFLNDVVIPHGKLFGYLLEIGELLVGVALIGGALVWLLVWGRVPIQLRAATLALITFSALAAVFMNINFHLANGSSHPWLIPGSGFDEGVDLDSLMPAIELALAGVTGGLLLGMWRSWRNVRASSGRS